MNAGALFDLLCYLRLYMFTNLKEYISDQPNISSCHFIIKPFHKTTADFKLFIKLYSNHDKKEGGNC